MSRKLGLDLIRINTKIKQKLQARFEELSLTRKEVCQDAREKGMVLQQSSLSRYINNEKIVTGSLTHEQVMWLCCRYCVPIKIDVQPTPYSDSKSEQFLNVFFNGRQKS